MFLLFNTALKKLLGYSILVSFRKPTHLSQENTALLSLKLSPPVHTHTGHSTQPALWRVTQVRWKRCTPGFLSFPTDTTVWFKLLQVVHILQDHFSARLKKFKSREQLSHCLYARITWALDTWIKNQKRQIKCNSGFACNMTCKKPKKCFFAFTHDEHQSISLT